MIANDNLPVELELTSLIMSYAETGVKAVDLAVALSKRGYPIQVWQAVLEQMVADQTITEIEFTFPSMPYRVKSFYVVSGTCVMVRGRHLDA